MKFYHVILIITAACIALTSCTAKNPAERKDLEAIVDNYCRDVAAGNYSDAYNKYLNSKYKQDIPLADFTSAHQKRKETYGALLEKKSTFMTGSSNIFSGTREYQLTYELKYREKTVHEVIRLNNEDGTYLIEGTYTPSSSKTLRFMVW